MRRSRRLQLHREEEERNLLQGHMMMSNTLNRPVSSPAQISALTVAGHYR